MHHPFRSLLPTCAALLLVLAGCAKPPQPPLSPQDALIAKGRDLFFNETFGGNGRTCGTCHPADNNFTIDPASIAKLPPTDPLFVAEFLPALKTGFESPRLMREFALIRENLDGFEDLDNKFTMRGVPHVLAMRNSVASPQGPRTGWSGDGAPGDGSLRSFATGAVIQHFTKTLNRVAGIDFRLPTDDELDAMEAFQLSLGRQTDLALPLPLKGDVALRGQALFLDNSVGKCNICHVNAGANARLGPNDLGNANFDTGVEALPDLPAKLSGEKVPPDDGFGRPGDKTFNVPPLVESAGTGAFFHNNAVSTIEAAVGFYDGDSFNDSPSGQFLKSIDPQNKGIELDATQISAIAAFLRVINAIENIRQSTELLNDSTKYPPPRRESAADLLIRAQSVVATASRVLAEGGL
ncbi:MAG: hypothetical protein OEY03_05815, partial [Rhizobacter sp.]|nr:hypothetical protein [Rhizobacter sp.]